MTDTKELRRLALLATPGPWYDTDHSDDPVDEPRVFTEDGMQIAHVYEDMTLSYPRERRLATQRANQQYIAAASPSVVLALLDEVEALKAALRSLNAVAIERGDKFGACDQIDNDGQPYQSAWLAGLLASPQPEKEEGRE